jgi:hypothetical protein
LCSASQQAVFLALPSAQSDVSADNGLTDADIQPGSAYVDFMLISLG